MESITQTRTTEELTPSQLQQIRHHLKEVLASPAFAGSKRAQDFLQLVVGHALVGEYDSLRERMIGAEMFGRPIDYDTGSDSVVRVKATEVRKKLAQYYLETDFSAVRIDLPSGSYVPRFGFQATEDKELATSHPPVETNPPQWIPEQPAEKILGDKVEVPSISPVLAHVRWRRLFPWVGCVLVVFAAYLGVRRYLEFRDATPIHTIAILPMENYSGIPSQEYFADGMTNELVSDLGQISKLPITPVATAMNYKGSKKTAVEVGNALGVDGVVEGSILREGSRVLIYVSFTAVKTGRVIWFHSYVRDLKTALAWQGEVSHAIVKEIDLAVTPQGQARYRRDRPIDPVSQDLFLHGKYLLESEDCANAADYFRAALNINFNYAQAQAALAFCDGHLGESDRVDSIDAFRMQKTEATRAIELDGSLAEGHAELARVDDAFGVGEEIISSDMEGHLWE